jgi:hypothetical protein
VSDPQGLISYPGLQTFTKAEYVLSQGISPGKCTIELPQELVDGLEATGDLTITYADQTITLPNCLLDSAHIDQGEKGYIARVTILDRRWQWKFGYISGHYNIRMPGGANANEGFNSSGSNGGGNNKIRAGTEQAPQDLATLCLQAMGEQNYDVSALPNDPRPEIDWSWHNPAEAAAATLRGARLPRDLRSRFRQCGARYRRPRQLPAGQRTPDVRVGRSEPAEHAQLTQARRRPDGLSGIYPARSSRYRYRRLDQADRRPDL